MLSRDLHELLQTATPSFRLCSWIMNLLMNIDMIVFEPIQPNHPSITLYVHVHPCLFSDQSLASTLLLHPFLSSFYKSLYLLPLPVLPSCMCYLFAVSVVCTPCTRVAVFYTFIAVSVSCICLPVSVLYFL